MKFFADESVDYPLVKLLRENDYPVHYAAEFMSASDDDDAILQKATKEASVLITRDKDFGEMVVRYRKISSGVVLIRVGNLNTAEQCTYILNIFNQFKNELPNSFMVIQEDKIRIRKL